MKIAIITINYNTAEETQRLLASLKDIKKPEGTSLEIIVIDNGSEETFALSHPNYTHPITILRSDTNTGFTGGNNLGIRHALEQGVDYFLLINNDTIVDRDLLKNLFTVLKNKNNCGIVVPKIYFTKGNEFHKDRYTKEELGKVFWYAGGSIDWANVMSKHRGVDEVDHGQYDTLEETNFATGCCLLVKREVFEKVGLFDDQYFLYFEDADLTERVKKEGYTLYYVPTAYLWHNNASSSGSGSDLHDYFLTRNRMLFGMRYAPLRTKLALIRESFRFLQQGRKFQKKGIKDFYLGKFGKGTYFQ